MAFTPVFKPSGDTRSQYRTNDGPGSIEIAVESDETFHRPAAILPLDDAIDVRIEALQQLIRRLRNGALGKRPRLSRLTALQKSRLVQLLQTHDIQRAGGGPREVAATVLRSKQAKLRAIEWKDSAARRKAVRLLHEGNTLVAGGYLKLLMGG